jgi:hypothetical protein
MLETVPQINQVFKPQKLEKLQQFNLATEELEARFRIIVALMVLLEKVERPAIQMPRVCRVLPGRRVGIVRGNNLHFRPVPGNAIDLFHGPEN